MKKRIGLFVVIIVSIVALLFGSFPAAANTSCSPGFEIGDTLGETSLKGGRAYFSVRLTCEPTSEVVLPMESSDVSEGVLTNRSVAFSKLDWNTPKWVEVTGSNHNDINGYQSYKIILGPAVSEDLAYDGLDPEDVALNGLNIKVYGPETLYFVSEVLGQRLLFISSNRYEGGGGFEDPVHTVLNAPEGVTVTTSIAALKWTPPKLTEGITHEVKIRSTLDGREFYNSVFLNVVPTFKVQGTISGNSFIVTDESSTLKDVRFSFRDREVPSDWGVREVLWDDLPPADTWSVVPTEPWNYFTRAFTLDNNHQRIDIHVPVDIVSNPFVLPKLNIRWHRDPHNLGLRWDELVEIQGRKYMKFEVWKTDDRLMAIMWYPK